MNKTILYRIYTEDKEQGQVVALVNTFFDCATIHKATGIWKGRTENSVVIEIYTDKGDKYAETDLHDAVVSLAKEIKSLLDQEAVLVTREEVQTTLI